MVDIDPGLDAKLRAFFDHIEASTPPSALTDVKVTTPDRRRRMINLFASLAAGAVVAASVTLFAVELRNHHGPAPAVTPSLPASAALLKQMPLMGQGGVPSFTHVVLPLTRGSGSMRLKTFVPQGTLYLQFDCAGPGSFKISSTNGVIGSDLAQCSTSLGVTTLTIAGPKGYDGKPLTLNITAAPSMSWEVFIAETGGWLPSLMPPQADSRALVPITYGTGSTTLPTFNVAPDEAVMVNVFCNSGSSGGTLEVAPDPLWPDGQQIQCLVFNADGSTSEFVAGPAVSDSGSGGLGPISLQFTADPSVSWEVQVSEGPARIILPELGNLGPVTQDVGVAPEATGMGSAVLPAFTTNQHYTIAFSCSGAGPLTVVTAGVAHVATTQCGGHTGWFTPPNQVTGQPISLSVEAPPSVGWEIQAVQVYGSTWGAGGATMPNGASGSPRTAAGRCAAPASTRPSASAGAERKSRSCGAAGSCLAPRGTGAAGSPPCSR